MKKTIIVLLTVTLLMSSIFIAYADSKPSITAKAAILIDAKTGDVLYEKNAHKQNYPASTTKVMTALIILENHDLDEVVTVDPESPYTSGSRVYIKKGEKFTVEQLLYALMLESANDAARALAIYHSGSIEDFSILMTERAKELGAKNTVFKNPNGLPNEKHLSTAYDLAQITKHAMKNETFRTLASTVKYQIGPTNLTDETRYLKTSNRFLWGTGSSNKMNYKGKSVDIKWDKSTGIKTGYTNAAQQCFVSGAQSNGQEVISVVLYCVGRTVYTDSKALLEYGLDNFNRKTLIMKNSILYKLELNNFKQSKVNLIAAKELTISLNKSINENEIKQSIQINDDITLPIKKGDTLGKIVFTANDKPLGEVDLLAMTGVSDKNIVGDITNKIDSVQKEQRFEFKWHQIILRLLIAYIIWRIIITYLKVKTKKIQNESKKHPPKL